MANIAHSLNKWLQTLVDRGGSDLFLVVGVPPAIRVAGNVLRLEEDPLESTRIEESILSVLSPKAVQQYRSEGYADASLRHPSLGRFRINIHHERGRPAAAIR